MSSIVRKKKKKAFDRVFMHWNYPTDVKVAILGKNQVKYIACYNLPGKKKDGEYFCHGRVSWKPEEQRGKGSGYNYIGSLCQCRM